MAGATARTSRRRSSYLRIEAASVCRGFELGERVEHMRILRGVATQLLECRARLGRTSGKGIELCQAETDLCARRIQLPRAAQLLLRFSVAAGLQIGEPEARVTERDRQARD